MSQDEALQSANFSLTSNTDLDQTLLGTVPKPIDVKNEQAWSYDRFDETFEVCTTRNMYNHYVDHVDIMYYM